MISRLQNTLTKALSGKGSGFLGGGGPGFGISQKYLTSWRTARAHPQARSLSLSSCFARPWSRPSCVS